MKLTHLSFLRHLQISALVDTAKNVVIFHSEPIVAFRGEGDMVQGRLFHLSTSAVPRDASSIFKTVQLLPQPNIIFGISAAGKNG